MSENRTVPRTATRRPRLFRFSLRLLFIAITILGIWLAVQVHRASQEKEARDAISPLARMLQYDFEFDDGEYVSNADPPGPDWLREWIGDEYFIRIHTVRFASETTDDDLARIKERLEDLRSLRNVDLATCRGVSDRGLAQLRHINRLQSLDLRKTSVTSSGLAALSDMSELEQLRVGTLRVGTLGSGPSVMNDDCLEHLAAIRGLRSLDLWGAGFSDAGLEKLEGLQNLRHLWLQSTRVTDQGLRHLRHLSNLEVLALESCDVSDAGLRQLTPLRHLKRLYLSGTKVSDAGLMHLAELRQLEKVALQRTQATAEGRAQLQTLLPNCEVD
jgi:hypothetical protein